MNILGILVILAAVGSTVGYVMKKKQELAVLSKLPAEEAKAYYEAILRREGRVTLIRVGALVALLAIAFVAAYHQ